MDSTMLKNAENTVAGAVATAAATGAIPIPFADAPLLIGQQVAMMAIIAKIFKIDIKKDGIKALATAAIGTGGATLLGRTIVSGLFKIIPGVGWIVGGAISASTAGIITYALGHAFIGVCKAVRLGEFDADELTSSKGLEIFISHFKDLFSRKSEMKSAIDAILADDGDFDYEYDEKDDWDEEEEVNPI